MSTTENKIFDGYLKACDENPSQIPTFHSIMSYIPLELTTLIDFTVTPQGVIEPVITVSSEKDIKKLLNDYDMSYIDEHQKIINCPVVEVW